MTTTARRMPWGMFYWSDYAGDEKLKLCSFAAQGLWMRMLCLAAAHDPVGYVAVNGQSLDNIRLARVAGGSLEEIAELVKELEANGVFSRDRRGWIYSRRMIADVKRRQQSRDTGELGGNPKLKGGYDKPGFVYLVGPRSDGAYKIGISVNPQGRLRKLRQQYPGNDLQLVEAWPCVNMGVKEAECHAKFRDTGKGEWFQLNDVSISELREFMASDKEHVNASQKSSKKAQSPESRVHIKEPSVPKHILPEDWEPEPFGDETESRTIVDSWSEQELKAQLEAFRAHHVANGSKFTNWQKAWSTWTLNSVRFASRHSKPGASTGDSFVDAMAADYLGQKKGDENG